MPHYTINFTNNKSLIGSFKIFPRAKIGQRINPRLNHHGGYFKPRITSDFYFSVRAGLFVF